MSGPYLIATIVRAGVYTLSDDNGQQIENGAEIKEEALTPAPAVV
jgi:hypothetical protein